MSRKTDIRDLSRGIERVPVRINVNKADVSDDNDFVVNTDYLSKTYDNFDIAAYIDIGPFFAFVFIAIPI